MSRLMAALLLTLVVGAVGPGPAQVLASTVPGTAVQVQEVDNFGATIWALLTGTPAKIGAVALLLGGASKLGGRQAEPSKAAYGMLGGGAIPFLGSFANTLFTSAGGATSVAALAAPLGAGWQFVVGLTGGRLCEDHLFLVILGGTVLWLTSRTLPDPQATV